MHSRYVETSFSLFSGKMYVSFSVKDLLRNACYIDTGIVFVSFVGIQFQKLLARLGHWPVTSTTRGSQVLDH